MLTHGDLWQAIDALASRYGYSTSGLAKAAGLDPTTFNKSKRLSEGKPRWPSTESLAKVLTLTGCTLFDLAALVHHTPPLQSLPQVLPLIRLDHAQADGVFTEQGLPRPGAPQWDALGFPTRDIGNYILDVVGDSLLPTYQDGVRLLLLPHDLSSDSSLRRGDRLILMFQDYRIRACELLRHTAIRLTVRGTIGEGEQVPEENDIDARSLRWVARVMWASQ